MGYRVDEGRMEQRGGRRGEARGGKDRGEGNRRKGWPVKEKEGRRKGRDACG